MFFAEIEQKWVSGSREFSIVRVSRETPIEIYYRFFENQITFRPLNDYPQWLMAGDTTLRTLRMLTILPDNEGQDRFGQPVPLNQNQLDLESCLFFQEYPRELPDERLFQIAGYISQVQLTRFLRRVWRSPDRRFPPYNDASIDLGIPIMPTRRLPQVLSTDRLDPFQLKVRLL